jgi:hypothetical protein
MDRARPAICLPTPATYEEVRRMDGWIQLEAALRRATELAREFGKSARELQRCQCRARDWERPRHAPGPCAAAERGKQG